MVDALRNVRQRAATVMTLLAGAGGLALLLLLGLNVASRLVDVNLVWIAELSRIVFLWASAFGMIAVSMRGLHFSIDLFNLGAAHDREPEDLWEYGVQLLACAVLAYILYYAIPSIARAATQDFASVPFSYGTMRLGLTVAVAGMLAAHAWRLLELVALRCAPRRRPSAETPTE